jgi:hypothetical protein
MPLNAPEYEKGNTMRTITPTLGLMLALAGCENIEVPAIQSTNQPSQESGGSFRKNDCLSDAMYLVEGDTFTYLSGGMMSFDTRGTRDETGTGWRPDIEPRAKCKVDLDLVRGKQQGYARLLWQDVLVQEVILDNEFAFGDKPAILAYQDPDGTRVELHVYAQPDCADWPQDVSTRAEVEALER